MRQSGGLPPAVGSTAAAPKCTRFPSALWMESPSGVGDLILKGCEKMKIAIIGYSGAGKSTLAHKLGSVYHCEVLHLDSIHFASDWAERTDQEMAADVGQFLTKDNWIIDGNYSSILYQQRMEEADQIILLDFNRLHCLLRAFKRYQTFKGKVRPDMADGCFEKFDWEFVRWILWEGRSKKAKRRYQSIAARYPHKTIVLKNQAQLDKFLNQR